MNAADKKPIYLDYAATTPVAPEVAEAMAACLTADGLFANPASDHAFGKLAQRAVAKATAAVAGLLNCHADELVFTSGATESNNLAIKGAFEFYGDKRERPHLITSKIEHKAVLDVADWLEQRGVAVTRLSPDNNGIIQPQQVAQALTDNTVLVSIQQVNNELGCVQPIAEIAQLLTGHGARLHVDAAQSVGKIAVDVQALGVDYLSLSAHKFYGPKGVGALYVRSAPRARLRAQIHGGLQQRGLRSGTLPVHQIVGLGKAAEVALENLSAESVRLSGLRQQLELGLSALPGVCINAATAERVPSVCNVTIDGIAGDSLFARLPHLMLSSGSACTSDNGEPSYVLRALGHNDRAAEASLRISLGRFTRAEDVATAVEDIVSAVNALRACSPWWPSEQAELLSQVVSPAWGDELQLRRRTNGEIDWKAAGRTELLVLMPVALAFYQQRQTVDGMLNELEQALEISSSRRYLLLLVEDLFKGLSRQ